MFKEKLLGAYRNINFKNIKEFNYKKYAKFFTGLLILIIIGLSLPRDFVHAGIASTIASVLMSVLYGVIYLIFYILFEVAYIIAQIGAYAVSISLNPAIMNNIFFNPAIYDSWTVIRDLCNLFFLLLMLLVAFGTIVQSSKYNVKNSLPKLILAIFLINFSNVIAGAIIDFGNILMYGILQWMCPPASTSCFQDSFSALMTVIDNYNRDLTLGNKGLDVITAHGATEMAIATIYTFMYGFILLALAVFLLVRTVGLVILMILSPFAYFGEVMPGMEKIAHKWWNSIWSYALFGPIFVLMLYISSRLASNIIAVPPITDPALQIWGTLIVQIIQNSIPLIFLLSIIPVTRDLGLAGSETIVKNTSGLGERIGSGAVGYASDSWGRYVARGASAQGQQGPGMKAWASRRFAQARRFGSNFSPTAIKQAYRAKQANDAKDYDIATGRMRNKLENVSDLGYGWGKDKYKKWTDPKYKSDRTDYEKKARTVKDKEKFAGESDDDESQIRDRIKTDHEKGDINPEINAMRAKKLASMNATKDMLEDLYGVGHGQAQDLENFVKTLSKDAKKQAEIYAEINRAEKANHNYDFEGGVQKYTGPDPARRGKLEFQTVADQKAIRHKAVQNLSPGARQNVKGIGKTIAENKKDYEDAEKAFKDADKAYILANDVAVRTADAADIAKADAARLARSAAETARNTAKTLDDDLTI